MDKIWAKLQKSLVQKDIKELFEVNKVRHTLINIFSIYRIFKKRLWFNHHNGWPAGKSHSLFSKCFRSITERFIVYSLQLGVGACLVWQKTKINHERCRILRTLASLSRMRSGTLGRGMHQCRSKKILMTPSHSKTN